MSSPPSTESAADEKTLESAPQPPSQAQDPQILTGKKLVVVFVGILLSLLLVALDQTILATALPRMASDFNAFSLQAWVVNSYLLSQTSFVLFYGQALRIFPSKWVLTFAIFAFELGSLITGVSQTIGQAIVGRTVSGVGAAGIFMASFQIPAQVVRLEQRARLFGLFGMIFTLASIIGPLIGGALTDRVTWRWCFYINLPIGGVSLVAVLFLLKPMAPLGSDPTKQSIRDRWEHAQRMDFIGATLVASAVTSILLALQWGGNLKPWNSAGVIVTFVFALVCAVAFIMWELYLGDRAMTPLSIFKSRSIYAIVLFGGITRMCLFIFSYYLPIFYQAARHASATTSGIDLLPLLLAVVFSVVGVGQLAGKLGYYWPFMQAAPVFLTVGAGLLYTITVNISEAKLVGYQILCGMGIGMGMQLALFAMQVEFRDTPRLISQATSLAIFSQNLGSTLGIGVAEPILTSLLAKYLQQYAPGAPLSIVKESPTNIYTELAPAFVEGAARAYAQSVRGVFLVGVPLGGIAMISAMFIENIRVQKPGAAAAPPSSKVVEPTAVPSDAEKADV